MTQHRLLDADEPPPVAIRRSRGASSFVLTCDHAGRQIPHRLGSLGLPASELDRHIAWDIGAARVSHLMADALDATLVEQAYSRLVIDCNRPLSVENSIPLVSEATPIPGNAGLSDAERGARQDEVFRPYHAAIEAELDRRTAAGQATVLIAMHSFTPIYLGETRPWHIGTLYGRDARLAGALHGVLVREPSLVVGDNEPYSVSDLSDYTIPIHGERRGLLHVGIEIRQDLIAEAAGQTDWAARLARLLPLAVAALGDDPAVDNLDILRRFERQPDGTWVCREAVTIATSDGPVLVGPGMVFRYGERRGHLDVAEYLEQLGAQFGS